MLASAAHVKLNKFLAEVDLTLHLVGCLCEVLLLKMWP